MNDHGTMTVETAETNECRHLVDYTSERIRSVLSGLPAGTTIPVQMARVGSRSNAWRVQGLPSVELRTSTDTRDRDRDHERESESNRGSGSTPNTPSN
jgi:hypothetical protein